MSSTGVSSADLKGVAYGGLINEDVMQEVIAVLDIDTKFIPSIGSDSVKNSYTEWTQKIYQAADLGNAVVDGDDASTYQTRVGARVGNHCQISRKVIACTTRTRHSDTIGYSDQYAEELATQTTQLHRDLEAIVLSQQGSQADDGNTTPGKAGALGAWLTSNTNRGATGADGGFANGVVSAPTPGTVRALSEKAIRDVCQSIYEQGFKPSVLMCRPTVKRLISEYMFTDTARIAMQQTETGKGGASTAVGSVKIFITDFDVDLVLTPNRLMPTADAPATELNDNVYIYDPSVFKMGYLHNYRTEPLAKLGLSDRAQVAVDWTLKVLAEQGAGVIADVNDGTAMVAG